VLTIGTKTGGRQIEIQEKLYILPDDIKKEILHYIDYLSQKYTKLNIKCKIVILVFACKRPESVI